MRLLAVLFVLALMGCGTNLPADPTHMSPEQLREWVKDKNVSVSCGTVNSPWGRGIAVNIGVDKGTVFNGTVASDDQCKVTITNDSRNPKP